MRVSSLQISSMSTIIDNLDDDDLDVLQYAMKKRRLTLEVQRMISKFEKKIQEILKDNINPFSCNFKEELLSGKIEATDSGGFQKFLIVGNWYAIGQRFEMNEWGLSPAVNVSRSLDRPNCLKVFHPNYESDGSLKCHYHTCDPNVWTPPTRLIEFVTFLILNKFIEKF